MRFIRDYFQILGYSPFPDLLKHTELCKKAVDSLMQRNTLHDLNELEREADKIKDKILQELSNPLILPVDKYRLIDLVIVQDNIISLCRDINYIISVGNLSTYELRELFSYISEISSKYYELQSSMKSLLSKAFVKSEVEKILKRIEDIEKMETEFEKKYIELSKNLFKDSDAHKFVLLKELLFSLNKLFENFIKAIRIFKLVVLR